MAGVFIGAAIVIVIGLIGWAAYVAYKKEQQRLVGLQSLCASKGWQFSAIDPYDLPERWEGAPFHQGYDRRASHVMTGTAHDRPMVAFDYEYKEDSTDSKGHRTTTTYHYGICALRLPAPLPALTVTPESVFGRFGTMLGMQDIELESEDFNRRYRVRCPDPKVASDVLTPRTMELLLRAPKLSYRCAGPDLLVFDDASLQPSDVLIRTEVLAGIIGGVPEFVWKDRGAP